MLFSEQAILIKARSFDQQALGTIYDAYSSGLYRYAMRLLGNQSLAEDCVADTFTRFLQALHGKQGPDFYLKAYLYRIAHNWITDYYRRMVPETLELDESLRSTNTIENEAQSEWNFETHCLRLAMRTLTADQRQVIMLKFVEEWQNQEIAAAMQKTVGAVKALQVRAIETLRKRLEQLEKEGSL